LTPEQLEKEKERVTLLLEINQALLHELVNMQKQGKGGNVQQPRNANPSDENEKLAAPEYVEYDTPFMDTKHLDPCLVSSSMWCKLHSN